MTADEKVTPILAEADRDECFRIIARCLKKIEYLEQHESIRKNGYQPN